jgi:hypothetical protein
MKPHFLSLVTALGTLLSAHGQSTLVDWTQTWNFMLPSTGVLPAESGITTPHPDGTTPWFSSESEFSANYSGPSFSVSGADFDAGSGDGPFGYGTINYFGDPLPAPAEFTDVSTVLATPEDGARFTNYFRTTFVVPDDGNFYLDPKIRYILDDGGYIYLDGELILRVNIANATDDYLRGASGTGNTETLIRTANLSLSTGSATGGNDVLDPVIGGNATVMKQVRRLTPGTHTLAISLHNTSGTSSDMLLALQLVSETSDCFIIGTFSGSSRNLEGTPQDATDDTIDADIAVVAEGVTSASWIVVGPEGSAAIGQTGAYDSSVSITGIPIAEFAGGAIEFTLADSTNATCQTVVRVTPPQIIASNNLAGTNLPVTTLSSVGVPGWVFDSGARSLTMNSPAGLSPRFVVTSQLVDLSGQADVQFSGNLEVVDTSSGNEEEDSFVAYLIYDGDTANPVNLITRHDLILADGILNGDELASAAGTFNMTLNHVVPASVDSVQIVIEGINNSASENFNVSGLGFAVATPSIQAYAGPVVFNNQGTDNPADDTFSAPFTITPANVDASTGWTSNATPASGFYTDPNPVDFGPFAPFTSPRTVRLIDALDLGKTADVVLTLDPPVITASGAKNIVRIENGPGFNDDTVTFDVTITGTNGGPRWDLDTAAISPTSGEFGLVSFTVPAPLVEGNFTFNVRDVSYAASVAAAIDAVTVNVTPRYIMGQSDLSGALVDVTTNLTTAQSSTWNNDAVGRALTLTAAGARLKTVRSEVVDLTAQDEVFFSALFRASDTSTGSNFETGDRFRAELFYTVSGETTTVNLVSQYDRGNGGASTTGTLTGADGPANGFINGYQGASGTDLTDETVYATNAEDYAAHIDRDEFNINGVPSGEQFEVFFPLSATIPAEADDVVLVISGEGVGNSESFMVSNVLFSTQDTTGDSDSDDIPNAYELANGLNPNDETDRDTDLDGDGQSNYDEFLAGTAANDPNSLLAFTSYTLVNGTVSASWSSVPGMNYRVEFSTDLVTWTDVGFDFPAADAPATETPTGDLSLVDLGTPLTAFFRVLVVATPE